MLLYMLPGIPSIYYGSEYAIPGDKVIGSDWNLRPDLNLADFDEKGPLPRLCKALGRIKAEFPEASYGGYQELYLTNRQYAFGRILDGKCIVTAVNNDDQPAHMTIRLPVQGQNAVNLLTRPEGEARPDEAALAEARKKLNDLKNELAEKAGQLVGAAGEIRDKAACVKDQVTAIDIEDTGADAVKKTMAPAMEQLFAAMKNMERVYNTFADRCGAQTTVRSSDAMKGCESVEIRNGQLHLDLAANSGAVIYVE